MYYGKPDILKEEKLRNNNQIKVNWKLYKDLLNFRSISNSDAQDDLANWLVAWCHKLPNTTVLTDKVGNLYITKGESTLYPCIIAHMDINQDYVADFEIVQTSKYIFGINNDTGEQCGLGHDDKAGIYFALHCLTNLDNVKVFFAMDEEIGGVGSNAADLSFFDDCSFLIQGDRNSYNNDISTYTNGVSVVSDVFKAGISKVLSTYKYGWKSCMYTDVGILAKRGVGICAVNFSIGYVREHSDNEVLIINHFINALNFGWEVVMKMKDKKWLHKSESEWSNYSYNSWRKDEATIIDSIYDKGYKQRRYHDTEGWKFDKSDEKYIQEEISIGQCPICTSARMETLEEGENVCYDCNSAFNIPEGKGIKEVWQEALKY